MLEPVCDGRRAGNIRERKANKRAWLLQTGGWFKPTWQRKVRVLCCAGKAGPAIDAEQLTLPGSWNAGPAEQTCPKHVSD